MRPDLNFEPMDRPGGLKVAEGIRRRLRLPASLQVFGPKTRPVAGSLTAWLRRRPQTHAVNSAAIYLHGAPSEWDLDAWRIGEILARLGDAGVETLIVVGNRALADAGMTLVRTLGLHRLGSVASVAVAPDLPTVSGTPVLAIVSGPDESIAIAACAESEAVPGADWGLGATAALVRGDAPTLPATITIDTARVVVASTGNARMIHARDRLDGPVSEFGRAFWKLLANEAPLAVAALRQHGVAEATYVDRYLVTPLTLRLLSEVLRMMPGTRSTKVTVQTARGSRNESASFAVYHPFATDAERKAVLQHLVVGVHVNMRDRAQLPHERTLTLRLGDGREVVVMVDQGLGAWRAVGAPRHNFHADPARQARALASARFAVHVEGWTGRTHRSRRTLPVLRKTSGTSQPGPRS